MRCTCSRTVSHKSLPEVYLIDPTHRTADSDTYSWWTSRSSNPVYISKPTSWSASHIPLPPDADGVKPSFPVVALGGTFDHLHAGHKILLSMAAWIARKKVIVGVTGLSLHPSPPSYRTSSHLMPTLLNPRRKFTRKQSQQTRSRAVNTPDRPRTVFPHFLQARSGVRYCPDPRCVRTDSGGSGHPSIGGQQGNPKWRRSELVNFIHPLNCRF